MSTGWRSGDKNAKLPGQGGAATGKKPAAKRHSGFSTRDAIFLALPIVLFGFLYLKLNALEKRIEEESGNQAMPAAAIAGYESRIHSLEKEIETLRKDQARLSETASAHEGVLSDLNIALNETAMRQAAQPQAPAARPERPEPPSANRQFTIVQGPSPVAALPEGMLDYSTFVDGYFDDQAAFDKQYRGKTITLLVKVQSVDKAGGAINAGGAKIDALTLGEYLIKGEHSKKYKTMECYFPAAGSASVQKLKKNDMVVIKGKVLGKGMSVYLSECEIVTP